MNRPRSALEERAYSVPCGIEALDIRAEQTTEKPAHAVIAARPDQEMEVIWHEAEGHDPNRFSRRLRLQQAHEVAIVVLKEEDDRAVDPPIVEMIRLVGEECRPGLGMAPPEPGQSLPRA